MRSRGGQSLRARRDSCRFSSHQIKAHRELAEDLHVVRDRRREGIVWVPGRG